MREALSTVDFADLCITSGIEVTGDPAPAEGFRLPDVPGVAVVFAEAEGEKCARCWKVLDEVGTDTDHPDVCGRCAEHHSIRCISHAERQAAQRRPCKRRRRRAA